MERAEVKGEMVVRGATESSDNAGVEDSVKQHAVGGLAAENERLHARVAALEAELVEVQARTNAAVAEWQEIAYWPQRWGYDLDALMRRPGAMELLAALRAVRGVWWRVKLLKRRLLGPS